MRFPLLGPFVLLAPLASAQTTTSDDPISTVRPRLTDTARIVPTGRFQIEAGMAFGFRGERIGRRNDFGEALLRYGVTPRLEARIELPTYSDYPRTRELSAITDRSLDGFSDLSVSVSWLLGRLGPVSLALRPRLTLPTGTELRTVDEPAPSVFLTAETAVRRGWSFASTVGYSHEKRTTPSFFPSEATFRRDIYRATFAAERAFGGRFSAFAEYSGDSVNGDSPLQFANAGARLRLSARSQVDVRLTSPIGRGDAPNFLGLGYAVRF